MINIDYPTINRYWPIPICESSNHSARLKDAFHGAQFLDITDGGRGAVGVHVVHLGRKSFSVVSGGAWRGFPWKSVKS